MTVGRFVDFLLPFIEDGSHVSAETQAERILAASADRLAAGADGVGITYSANFGQTRTIEATYFAGGWDTGTAGSNQAAVMRAMEERLGGPAAALRGQVHILPITTMNAYEPGLRAEPWTDDVLLGIVISDLARVRWYLDAGWDVLGWQHQDTVDDPDHPYAVGGGVATLPPVVDVAIQQTLVSIASGVPRCPARMTATALSRRGAS